MQASKVGRVKALLKSIETGDPAPIAVVNQARYIQHNPQTHEGSEGLETLFKRLSLTNPKVNIVRAFEDGEFVFGHTEYDFSSRRIGFEVFRYEDDQVVEHWDNIQPRKGPNLSAHSMVDGPTEVHKVTVARTVLRDYEAAPGLFPTYHSPTLKAAAMAGASQLTSRKASAKAAMAA